LKAPYFRFNHRFNEINPEPFLLDLFNSGEVKKHLNYVIPLFSQVVMKLKVHLPGGMYSKIGFNKLKCEVINIEMLGKLEENGSFILNKQMMNILRSYCSR